MICSLLDLNLDFKMCIWNLISLILILHTKVEEEKSIAPLLKNWSFFVFCFVRHLKYKCSFQALRKGLLDVRTCRYKAAYSIFGEKKIRKKEFWIKQMFWCISVKVLLGCMSKTNYVPKSQPWERKRMNIFFSAKKNVIVFFSWCWKFNKPAQEIC